MNASETKSVERRPAVVAERFARSGRASGGWRMAFGVLLALATGWAYWPALGHEYIAFDDPQYVTENPMVQAGLTWAGAKWAFATGYFSYWHPLTWLSHMLDAELFGASPTGPHVVNVSIHVANSILLAALLSRLTGTWWRGVAVAALFALHPLRVESVAWVAERKDVLSAFFFLLTLWAYARYASPRGGSGVVGEDGGHDVPLARARHRWRWYGVSLGLFACALMSKPMVVTLPCVLLLLDVWPLRRLDLSDVGVRWQATFGGARGASPGGGGNNREKPRAPKSPPARRGARPGGGLNPGRHARATKSPASRPLPAGKQAWAAGLGKNSFLRVGSGGRGGDVSGSAAKRSRAIVQRVFAERARGERHRFLRALSRQNRLAD